MLTRSSLSLSLHVNVRQDVEIKHPVGVHVFVGLQVHVAMLLENSFLIFLARQELANVANYICFYF